MKIYSTPIATVQKQNYKPSFRAGLSPNIKKQALDISKNPATRNIFLKMAGVLGLTSIIAWVNTLKGADTSDTAKIDSLNEKWSQKQNEYFLDSNLSGKYLNLVSSADSTESVLLTEALLSENFSEEEIAEIEENAKNLFLEESSHETYMTISADKKLATLISQIKALNSASEEQKTKFLENLTHKFNSLVKQSEGLKNAEETANLHEKIANIIRIFALTNMFEKNSDDKEAPKKIDVSGYSKTGIWANVEKDSEKVEEQKPVEVPEKTVKNITIDDLKKNPEYKEFIEGILETSFDEEGTTVSLETYTENIPFIMDIYDNFPYSEQDSFINMLRTMKLNDTINNYKQLSDGKVGNFNFKSYYYLEQFKKANGALVTKEEFKRLEQYLEESLGYFQAIPAKNGYHARLKVVFNEKTTAEKRLSIMSDLHKIAFNIEDKDLIVADNYETISEQDVAKELVLKLLNSPDEYAKILQYLKTDIDSVYKIFKKVPENSIDKAATELISTLSQTPEGKKLFNNLHKMISNKAFNNFIVTPHARMRFIERIIFKDSSKLNLEPKLLNNAVKGEVDILKQKIIHNSNWQDKKNPHKEIFVTNYKTKAPNTKQGASISLDDNLVLGLDKNGHIHTIYYSS